MYGNEVRQQKERGISKKSQTFVSFPSSEYWSFKKTVDIAQTVATQPDATTLLQQKIIVIERKTFFFFPFTYQSYYF